MKSQEVLDYIDNLIFNQTGKHLDNLQFSILKGISEGKKYPDIAKEYKCTKGHVKDEAYELWHILSKALGEDVNRSNFYATVERLKFTNQSFKSIIGHTVNVDNNINFCPTSQKEETAITNDNFVEDQINSSNHKNGYQLIIEQAQKRVKLETIPNLLKIGLTPQQIAEALGLSLEEVEENI